MQKLQDTLFTILKTSSLSPAVFNFLQPTEDVIETPLGGILKDTKYGWLALGPKFCVVDLRSGLKVAAKTFCNGASHVAVTSVVEIPRPLTNNSQQLIISLEVDDTGLICVLHVNGSQILRCIETDVVITELALCDDIRNGPFTCFDGLLMAGTQAGEVLVIDFNRNALIQALTDITEGNTHLIKDETKPANLAYLSMKTLHKYESQGEFPVNNNEHYAVLLNEDSFIDGQYIFRNPDGTVRMKAKKDHVRVTVVQYIPQLGSLAVGYNFGAFQLWNMLDLELEFTSQVNVECLPVTHFGFQEPCDDPRAFCYLWVVFSVTNRFEEHEFPLAVMYSLTYQGKRMLVDNKCLYQEFSSATIRFQLELGAMDHTDLVGGRCISTHTFFINTMLGEEGEDTMLNLCQLVWECWGEQSNSSEYGMLLFDLDQWYKDQMPATYPLQSNTFMSTAWCSELGRGSVTLDLRLDPSSLSPYSHATRLEEHFYPNSLQYNCICLNTSEAIVLHTVGIQRQIINSMSNTGPSCLLSPGRLYTACVSAGLVPAYRDVIEADTVDEQRKFLLSVALEARMSQFLKKCAQDWATGTHTGVGCTLTFLVDWAWKRAIELKENAKELISPLFTSATLPDRNVIRCLEHCVQQLSQLTALLDAILTKCCNLVVPDALSEIEEKYKGIGTVSLYFQVVQWFLRVGLLPERNHPHASLPYPADHLYELYKKRRTKLHRIQGDNIEGDPSCVPSSLLYVDQLIVNEFGGDTVHQIWLKAGSECGGLYPPPSLYALLRLYLLPDISEEHKHSLLLYLLLDYSMLYDDAQYETVIRRLMQFPPMFGLSTTLVRATQAFWHLDHRDFHFALDQLQCLTGNTLSEWQHQVVLSSLLAQKKSQAALQYLHVRKPAPIQSLKGDSPNNNVNGHDKLEDWQSCCNLYLARGLVFEALDVVRMCSQNAGSIEDKMQVLKYFFKGCRKSGHLSKVLQISLSPLEEDVFIKYLKECNEPQTSDILIMYYLQQARYLEAEQYNKQLKSKRSREMCRSSESVSEVVERTSARELLVELMCSAVPHIAASVADCATTELEHVLKPKPLSVYVKPKSPKNTFTYKSTFIQDTIENASETWMNKPKMKKSLKRALSIDETPFICTPKLYKIKSYTSEQKQNDSTPAKRARLDLSPKTPKNKSGSAVKVSSKLSEQIATLLEMPDVQSPLYKHSTRPETPHSILKTRRLDYPVRDIQSPMESRYLADSDEEMETASNHTHCSDANKHLRFTIPTPTELDSNPTPVAVPLHVEPSQDTTDNTVIEQQDISTESPPKKFAAERIPSRKSYKDTVKARKSLSISANSSLSDDPNTSIESIADIPVTLINPKYSGERRTHAKTPEPEEHKSEIDIRITTSVRGTEDVFESTTELSFVPKTPKGRRSIRSVSESTPVLNRNRSVTPERLDSPVTPLRTRLTRSRSRTPEISPRTSPLPAIQELPKLELETAPHPTETLLSKPIPRSRSRTPERVEKLEKSPRLEVITESPTKPDAPAPISCRRSLRSRSRTPEVEIQTEQHVLESPRNLRSRSKTPEKLMSPKKETITKTKKSLTRIVLEANTFSKTKHVEKMETEITEQKTESIIECTPMKPSKQMSSIMDMTFSPIDNKSILHSSHDSNISMEKTKSDTDSSPAPLKIPAFTNITDIHLEESILHSYQSSIIESSSIHEETKTESAKEPKLPALSINRKDTEKSVLHSCDSSVNSSNKESESKDVPKPSAIKKDLNVSTMSESILEKTNVLGNVNQSSLMTSDSEIEIDKDWKEQETANVIQKEKEKIVEIEREINEIEGDLSDESGQEAFQESAESEESDNSNDEVEQEQSSSNEESEDSVEEVISIQDSDSEDDLQMDVAEDIQLVAEQFPQATENQDAISEIPPNVENEEQQEAKKEVEINEVNAEDSNQVSETVETSTDPLNQAHFSLLTDDNSTNTSIHLNYSDDNQMLETAVKQNKDEEEVTKLETPALETPKGTTTMDVEESSKGIKIEGMLGEDISKEQINKAEDKMEVEIPKTENAKVEDKNKVTEAETKSEDNMKVEIQRPEETKDESKKDVPETKSEENPSKDTNEEKPVSQDLPKVTETPRRRRNSSTNKTNIEDQDTITEVEKPKTRSRRQSKTEETTEEIKTPSKTLQSPEKSEVLQTPEFDSPRTRSRSKTPSSEVRRILTRRASRELSEKDELTPTLEELTPRRRTRASSKKDDDASSIASSESVKTTTSKASEEEKTRKGRKTLKTELTVIPEAPVEDSKGQDIDEYSTARRLTRHQKSLLERSETKSPSRVVSEIQEEDDTLEPDDYQDSTASLSSASKSRGRRATSETKAVVKAAKIGRRTSVDVVAGSGSEESPVGTPTRGRRASFNKAIQAIHTPKGRRTSTDVKGTDSNPGSPATSDVGTVTPARRSARRASSQSNTNTPEPARRTRKGAE